jgi:hypothetical protein
MLRECPSGDGFNKYPDYSDCRCGRSSRWYAGITITKDGTASFTCIFCMSGTEEGSNEAVSLYGTMGKRHRFFLVD